MLKLGQHFGLEDRLVMLNVVPPFSILLPLIVPLYVFGLRKAMVLELRLFQLAWSIIIVPISAVQVTIINSLLLIPAFIYGIIHF